MAIPTQLPPEVVDALRRGDPMGAMKAMKKAHPSMGLADVRKFLQAVQKMSPANLPRHGAAKPSAPPASHSSTPHTPKHAPAASIHTVYFGKGLSPGEVPRSGDSAGPIVLMVIAVMALLLYMRFG